MHVQLLFFVVLTLKTGNRGIQQLTIFSYHHLIQLLFISVSVGATEATCVRAGLVSFQTRSAVAPDEEQSNSE